MESVEARSILHKNKSSGWFGTDYNMNLYRGCCHGCIYCDRNLFIKAFLRYVM